MEFKAAQLQRLPRKWVQMEMQFQHSEVWKKRRSQEKRLEEAAGKTGGTRSSHDALDEKVSTMVDAAGRRSRMRMET